MPAPTNPSPNDPPPISDCVPPTVPVAAVSAIRPVTPGSAAPSTLPSALAAGAATAPAEIERAWRPVLTSLPA